MEEHPKVSENERDGLPPSIEQKRWLIDLIIILVIAGLAFVYWYKQQLKVRHLAAQELLANASINDLQRRLNNLTDELSNVAAAQQAAADAGARSTRKQTPKTKLEAGERVSFRPRGSSMSGKVREWPACD